MAKLNLTRVRRASAGRGNRNKRKDVEMLPPLSPNGDLQQVKDLYRISSKTGRVKYVIIYVDGEIREANSSNIYDYVPPQVLHAYEHMCFVRNYNMETFYSKNADMGAWARGTSRTIIKEMERAVRRARVLAMKPKNPNPVSGATSEKPKVILPSMQQHFIPRTSLPSVHIPVNSRKRKLDDWSTTEFDDEECQDEKVSDPNYEQEQDSKQDLKGEEQVVASYAGDSSSDVPSRQRVRRALGYFQPPKNQHLLTSFFGPTGMASSSAGEREVVTSPISTGRETDDPLASPLDQDSVRTRHSHLPIGAYKIGRKPVNSSMWSNSSLNALPNTNSARRVISGLSKSNPKTKSKRRVSSRHEIDSDENSVFEVEAIVGHRIRNGVNQYEVKWVGFPTQENTWEPIGNLEGSLDLVQVYHGQIDGSVVNK